MRAILFRIALRRRQIQDTQTSWVAGWLASEQTTNWVNMDRDADALALSPR